MKLYINLGWGTEEDYLSLPPLVKDSGFDGFFPHWHNGEGLSQLCEDASRLGLSIPSLHAPFTKVPALWETGEETEQYVLKLLSCVDDCANMAIPVMVMHAYKGFGEYCPNELGVENFRRVAEHAAKRGVKIALENTEGEEYLAVLAEAFRDAEHIGFCWDSGHEHCYNEKDMLALYGDKIFATHLNDNLGKSGEKITFFDDLHLLPFDGNLDWEDAAKRLKKCAFTEDLTFELKRKSIEGRHENDSYREMTIAQYLACAYARAKRFGDMLRKNL